ncbi:hypothetical protein FRC14_002495 [Serendipita sp. 396]|nr:hypothetical protein FRC14_002495 [Serendipita sp. 396]
MFRLRRPQLGWALLQRRSSTLAAHLGPYKPRTHTCGELDETCVGQHVDLCGWVVQNRKISKKLAFFVLQDIHGQVQLLATSKSSQGSENSGNGALSVLGSLPLQSTVQVSGVVKRRLPSAVTPGKSGAIEVEIVNARMLNPASEQLPFLPNDENNLPNEEFRLKHRHLDLRRRKLSSNLHKRSEISHKIRNYLHSKNFVEVETPMLLKSTPEGAREYLVPTRLSKIGAQNAMVTDPESKQTSASLESQVEPMFYALSQSPQQPKQILISSGAVERYFQFARCFRDEDGRADRQPEFTQIDLEMAWVSWGGEGASGLNTPQRPFSDWRIGGREVRDTVEGIVRTALEDQNIEFPVMRYEDAMSLYGSDKPDLRWDKQIVNLTSHLSLDSQNQLADRGLVMEGFFVPGLDLKEKLQFLKELPHDVKVYNTDASDLCHLKEISSGNGSDLRLLTPLPGTNPGDTIFTAIRPAVLEGGWTPLGRLRASLIPVCLDTEILRERRFLWVTEFPLFTRDEDKEFLAHGRLSSSHHPFTAPMVEDIPLLLQGGNSLSNVRGQHYDLVLNGTEIAGGSVRVHDSGLQKYIFEHVLKLSPAEMERFSELVRALESGAPPHAGIAIGFDRFMAILCEEPSIRNVVAFPKTAAGVDPLFKSPTAVALDVLELYGLQPKTTIRAS